MDLTKLDLDRLPHHVGIILDGNGRWAEARGLPRTAGHIEGEEAIFRAADAAIEIGLEWLTLYTFSTENWLRSSDEVSFLLEFNIDLLSRRRNELIDRNVRIYFIGDLDDEQVPDSNRAHMRESEAASSGNDGLNLVFAFNYGGRREVVDAVRSIAAEVAEGTVSPEAIDEGSIAERLYLPACPDPDLILRTSGEQRISNFLLWGSAYAELMFPDVLWPDFQGEDLIDALVQYQKRSRRFGTA